MFSKNKKTLLFANYCHIGKHYNSIGDQVQILAIDDLYSKMSLNENDVIYIDTNNLSTYNGEPVLLPVSMPLLNHKEHGIAGLFSEKITPIFFGLTMVKDTLLPEEIEYLKKNEPIGCRDERTFNTMIDYGISAYLGGCLTATLPKRKQNPEKQNKVFIIDPTKGINDYIPKEIANTAVWGSHDYNYYIENPVQLAEEKYQQYFNEAKLVITSLLHASIPCMAYGVPVILAKDSVSYRFGWTEALLHIYTPDNYTNINWNPLPVEYESHKSLLTSLFQKRMIGECFSKESAQVHDFYMNRKKNKYVIDYFDQIQEFLNSTWLDHKKQYKYSVWGLTQITDITVNYISKHYPKAELMHVYDLQPGLTMNGIPSKSPENIVNFPDETIFVTTPSAAESAEKLFYKINKSSNFYKIIKTIH